MAGVCCWAAAGWVRVWLVRLAISPPELIPEMNEVFVSEITNWAGDSLVRP